jgi:hypothetical protein
MEGNDRYAFDYHFPADENLYVMVSVYEIDVGHGDPVGRDFFEYIRDMNYGAGGPGALVSQSHRGTYTDWRITRLQ